MTKSFTFKKEDVEGWISQETGEQEALRSKVTEWMAPEVDGVTVITKYVNDLPLLRIMDAAAKRLAKTKEEPCKVISEKDGAPCTRLTKTGRALADLCNIFDRELVARHCHHAFNPWIKVMVLALCHWHPGHRFEKVSPSTRMSAIDQACFSRMARFVRRVSRSPKFKRRLQDERRLARQNYRSACTLMTTLFARHARLLILRVDLYYRDEGRQQALTEEAQGAFERFVRMLRCGRIVPDVLGYLISREVGAERGVHFHLLVAMDGHKHRDAYGFAKMIGDRWVKDYAGDGRGAYFNCYTRRNDYAFNGLGLVHISDSHKLIGVRQALQYMTKVDYLVKLKDRSERNFRRSLIKQVKVKMGAPRHPDHEMSTVWRIFGERGKSRRSTSSPQKSP